MGIFDRFRSAGEPRGRTYEGQPVEPSPDEQALARYRYMLRTAPPETIEQAHAEAFAQLTPPQRRMLLEQLRAELPETERAYVADDPQSLARFATRTEVRQPGTIERMFSGVPGAGPGAGPGFGGMMASSLLGSVAGTVLGTMIAQSFLGSHGLFDGAPGHGHGADLGHGADHAHNLDADAGDLGGGFDDIGGGFDGGSFDV